MIVLHRDIYLLGFFITLVTRHPSLTHSLSHSLSLTLSVSLSFSLSVSLSISIFFSLANMTMFPLHRIRRSDIGDDSVHDGVCSSWTHLPR